MPLTASDELPEMELDQAKFSMFDGTQRVVCYVDAAAIEDIEHSSSDLAERRRIFDRRRSAFEQIASVLYDRGMRPPRVTTKDLRG